jgi:hypothetical protein
MAGERPMLEAWLEFHRATLRWKCEGLAPEQLVLPAVNPSRLTLLGLVRHLAEVERSWFRRRMAGEDAPPIYYSDDGPDDDLLALDPAQAGEAFAIWDREVQAAREIAARIDSLDTVAPVKRNGHDVSLRWIYCHMIEEYARHNGHADLLREAIDGTTGE